MSLKSIRTCNRLTNKQTDINQMTLLNLNIPKDEQHFLREVSRKVKMVGGVDGGRGGVPRGADDTLLLKQSFVSMS